MSSGALLALQNISVRYGGIAALTDLSLELKAGEIVSLIGANGAGKTSCLRAISGLQPLSQGSIQFAGKDVTHKDPAALVKQGLVHVPEGRMILVQQSVEDNLRLGAFTRRDKSHIASSLLEVFASFPRLKERRRQLAGTLSGGEQQMLALARALMARPRVLLLDEPSLGLAPLMVQEIFSSIQKLNEEGMSILLVEQNAQIALSMAHRAYVLESGHLVITGKGAELLHDKRVQESYLGS